MFESTVGDSLIYKGSVYMIIKTKVNCDTRIYDYCGKCSGRIKLDRTLNDIDEVCIWHKNELYSSFKYIKCLSAPTSIIQPIL